MLAVHHPAAPVVHFAAALGQLIEGATSNSELFTRIPYILADSRADVIAYLGFRHVTGIKQWDPAQKAEFIASMIDDMGMSYDSVRKQIGMQTGTVRRNYMAYRIVKQMESRDIEVSEQGVERRFSVLFLSLRGRGRAVILRYRHKS